MKVTRLFSTLVVITALLLGFISSPASAETILTGDAFLQNPNTNPYLEKIEPSILNTLSTRGETRAGGSDHPLTTNFFVWLAEQADLSPAGRIAIKVEKGRYVYDMLQNTADRSQLSLRAYLDQQGIGYRSFFIANAIFVQSGDLSLVLALAARPDVGRITGNAIIQMPQPLLKTIGPDSPAEIEPNITFINADDAWALGVTGQGTVLAAIDTGIQWDHPGLINHYRGWDGAIADHNYNWWDATGQYPNEPMDGHGHGTMVTGVMVGGEETDTQIGVAPGAKTIHCKAINDFGSATEQDLLECFQWILAPWDLTGANPHPELAPDALTNSWGSQSGIPGLELAIDALQMAGILVEASVGGEGPGCGTLVSPADFAQVLSTGGVDHTGGVLPGTPASFSARGPSTQDPSAYIPDVMAPSIDIRSSFPSDDYQVWSGTSLAGPHATALVGLMWSANPLLRGNIIDTDQIIYDTAVPLTGQMGSNCGGDYETGPNNDWGYGTIDALAAVQQAQMYGDAGTLQGAVTDAFTLMPLAGVEIMAEGFQQWITATNSLGLYRMVVPSDTYTVSATLAGYFTQGITGTIVISGELATQDFALRPVQVAISGTVTDVNTHAPLFAEVQVNGGLITSTHTNPATGIYSLTLAANHTYTLTAQASGYGTVSVVLDVLNENTRQDFNLPAGWLSLFPLALNFELISGQSLTWPLTLTNMGGLSLTFTLSSTAGWLMVSPSAGALPISGTLVLDAYIDSAGLVAPGVYTTTLIVETDTPYDPISLPVTLTIIYRQNVYLPLLIYPAEGRTR